MTVNAPELPHPGIPSRRAILLTLIASAALTACGVPPLQRAPVEAGATWQGRLAVRVDATPTQAFAADFELTGSADQGQLLLLSPLGTAVARLRWTPGLALLERPGTPDARYDNLPDLARAATGVDLPVRQLFDWLGGKPAPAPGWEVDLGAVETGRVNARRLEPEPTAEVRILLTR